MIANLRNLALAELRAATDGLTGLPNQRAVQDTLKRMVAQAGRPPRRSHGALRPRPLQADQRHLGHDKGDDVLAAVGDGRRAPVRDSDFVGRVGGEEFAVLLPGHRSRRGARGRREAPRRDRGALPCPASTADHGSFGVAVMPDEGGERDRLLRMADRALYAAKRERA